VKLRILIADDNRTFRDSLRQLLETQADYQIVAEATNGTDAIEKVTLFQPDVLIIDYLMPELDGISAIARVRLAAPHTEVLLLTQNDAPYTAQRAIEAGARGYVVKSNAGHDLFNAIDSLRQHKVFVSEAIARGLSSLRR
jgi:DNA-binding NarL/FixJ family response regulator